MGSLGQLTYVVTPWQSSLCRNIDSYLQLHGQQHLAVNGFNGYAIWRTVCLLVVSANCGASNVALEYPLRRVSYSQQNYFISTLATLNWRIKNIFEDWQEFKYPLMPRLM